MITSLLIANRGEIACRIIRTARAMGIRTVAVYSDADAKALHVRQADEAVHIGPSPARESYLVGDKIIAAARATNAEAIHPGYGFLSENADFAQSVIDAGIVWVGPRPASIRAMGLKDAAKTLMADAGVPVTPGYMGEDQSPERLAREAHDVGYPVLIKAVAGGGGKGMRRVDDAAEFADSLASCQREAAASFGNAHVLIEKYIQRPRHIEVQVFGDSHGNIVHLFERDCSLQRRHQKVIEEAPAPGMDDATRAQLCNVAVRAAKAVDYVGAGTIEFIADASDGLRADRIWFMEMNTRLQVEHPVTEEITGVDLVEWQLRVASGEPLPKRQDELAINGWAMEARLYAEDPATGFLPSTGQLKAFRFDDFQGDLGLRLETGIEEGDAITPFYDPMIAKIVAHGARQGAPEANRVAVASTLAIACEQLVVWPVRTNAAFLAATLKHPGFGDGDVTTSFLAEHDETLTRQPTASNQAIARAASLLVDPPSWPRPLDPWEFGSTPFPPPLRGAAVTNLSQSGLRLNANPVRTVRVRLGDDVHVVEPASSGVLSGTRVSVIEGGVIVTTRGFSQLATLDRPYGVSALAGGDGVILSPMPGRVIAVDVAAGDTVTRGQKLVTLEAMKMEHSLVAPFDGVVAELAASAGGQVSEGTMLVRVEAA